MAEAEAGAGQGLPAEAESARPSLSGGARGRVGAGRGVDADLMGATRLEPHLEQGGARERLDDGEVGQRLAATAAADGPFLGSAVVAAEGGVDRPRARSRLPLDQRQVDAPKVACL